MVSLSKSYTIFLFFQPTFFVQVSLKLFEILYRNQDKGETDAGEEFLVNLT